MLLLDPSLPPALAEARLLHPKAPDGSPGYFVVARVTDKWRQKAYRVDGADQVLSTMEGAHDVYMSQATFVTRRRLAAFAHTLRCAFVDLDLYNVDLIADDASICAIVAHARAAGIPEPSLVVSSGRGLYAKWVFDQPITSTLMPQWQALQSTLIALYKQFGCDPKVRDAARVLRPASTINSKNGAQVRVVLDTGRTWTFAQLCEQVGQLSIEPTVGAGGATVRTIRDRSRKLAATPEQSDLGHLVNYAARREPIMMRQMTAQSLNWARFLDLRDLALSRGGFERGARDNFLFWMASFLAHSGVIYPGNFWEEVGQLLQAFPKTKDFRPCDDGSLLTLKRRIEDAHAGKHVHFKGARYSPIYTPSNDLLINLFEITATEEQSLRTVISSGEKQRRADLKAPGRAERRETRCAARETASSLHEAGASADEIAAAVARSRATVYRWLAKARPDQAAEPGEVVEMRGSRSPYAVHQQSLPPARISSTRIGPVKVDVTPGPSPRKPDARELTERELRIRSRRARKKDEMAPAKVADYVACRLEEIRVQSLQRATHREHNRRLELATEDALHAQAMLRVQTRLMRILEHLKQQPAGDNWSIEPGRLKSGVSSGRLSGRAPPPSAPPPRRS